MFKTDAKPITKKLLQGFTERLKITIPKVILQLDVGKGSHSNPLLIMDCSIFGV